MVRLEVEGNEYTAESEIFQFQYGTIRRNMLYILIKFSIISIPVWYD